MLKCQAKINQAHHQSNQTNKERMTQRNQQAPSNEQTINQSNEQSNNQSNKHRTIKTNNQQRKKTNKPQRRNLIQKIIQLPIDRSRRLLCYECLQAYARLLSGHFD